MKSPQLSDKLLELYARKEEPDSASLKRSIESYLRRKYPDRKIEKIIDNLQKKHDFKKELASAKCMNNLSLYIDSIVLSMIRDSFKSSKPLNIDEMEEIKFKALVRLLTLHFGYEPLYLPFNSFNNIDIIVHRGEKKAAVFGVKGVPGHNLGVKTVRQARYLANHYHCERVIIMTNALFDDEAVNEAAGIGVTLLGREKLLPLVQDLIDNRQREETELLVGGINDNKNAIFLEGIVKYPKTKVQVVYIKYFIDEDSEALIFEGRLYNNGKRPVEALVIDIKLFDRHGDCAIRKNTAADHPRLESKEQTDFKLVFGEIAKDYWKNLCRYEFKLEYSNVYVPSEGSKTDL